MDTAPATTVEVVKISVEVPKEMNDIATLVIGVVQDLKAGKSPMDIAGENLPALMTAIVGFEKLGIEAQHAGAIDCGALMGAGITKALLGKA